MRAGALSARGRPYAAKTIAGYEEGLKLFLRLAPECGIGGEPRTIGTDELRRYATLPPDVAVTPD